MAQPIKVFFPNLAGSVYTSHGLRSSALTSHLSKVTVAWVVPQALADWLKEQCIGLGLRHTKS
jgi:hypothetical protein